jgi:hypothetical protein
MKHYVYIITQGLYILCNYFYINTQGLYILCNYVYINAQGLHIRCNYVYINAQGLHIRCNYVYVNTQGLHIRCNYVYVNTQGLYISIRYVYICMRNGLSAPFLANTFRNYDYIRRRTYEKEPLNVGIARYSSFNYFLYVWNVLLQNDTFIPLINYNLPFTSRK